MAKKARPSDERRAALKASELNKIPNISNLTPIQRYYALSLRLLKSFYLAADSNKLDEAYVFGLRFAKFSSEVLPTHDYYKVNQPEYVKLRKENKRDLKTVIDKLEEVVELMDLEELEKKEMKRREEEAMRLIKQREEEMRKEEEERAATQALLDRLNMLDNFGPVPTGYTDKKKKSETKVEKENELEEFDEMEEDISALPIGNLPLPIPMPIPQPSLQEGTEAPPPAYDSLGSLPPPPSYDALVQHEQNKMDYRQDSIMDLRPSSSRSLHGMGPSAPFSESDRGATNVKTFINPLQGPLMSASLADHGDVTNKTPTISFQMQKQHTKQEYFQLRNKKKIEIFQLGTYQGKSTTRDSTNGCTVISPLVAVNHLRSEGSGISDMKIEQVINEIAPGILSKVRRKLGLSGHALIIPSDVHDFLVDEKILKQEMFVGVCGGNVLDRQHVGGLIDMLENGEEINPGCDSREEKKDSTKKVAAALFFHEHVISILKVVLPDGSKWYDLVDSLPTRINDRLGATRTRCKDRQSLESLLYWYACDKFSPADITYIDNNNWDDNMCDFDPRVFQGFVWKE